MSGPRPGLPRGTWVAVGVAVGAAAGSATVSPLVTLALGCLLAGAGLVVRAHPGARVGVPVLAAGLGLALVALRLLAGPAPGPPPPLPADSRGPWIAVVESVGSPRDGDQVARLRLSVAGDTVTVAAMLPAYPVVTAEAMVEVEGRLRPPPEGDPYGAYLRRTGASGSLDGTRVRIVAPGPGISLQALRDGAGDALRLALPEPEAGLAAGILVGLRERVDRELATDFASAGASHVVAISGWNIAIVAGITGAILRGRSRRTVAVAIGGTVVAYTVAAGASPSVVRAAVMASVVLLARESGRAGRAPAALAAAAAILLLAAPALIEDAGFRLSVLATAGLLAWATPLGEQIGRAGGGRVPNWLAECLGISLAAQAATLPDVLATFGRLSLVSPAVNLLVVPLVPVAMAGGVLALGGGAATMAGAPAWVATLAGLPGWLALHVIVAVVRGGAAVPFAAVALPPELAGTAGLAAAAALGGLVVWRRQGHGRGARRGGAGRAAHRSPAPRRERQPSRIGRPARVAVAALIAVAAIGSAAATQAVTRDTRLTVLDVGQGDAILLESRDGARMLVDGGPDPGRLLLELDARIPPWDRRIDIAVLTHPHEDHVAGLAGLLDRYRVRQVYEPGMRGPGPGWAAWDSRLADGPSRGTLATGARIRLGEIELVALWPDPGTVARDPPDSGMEINNVSLVLLGSANGRRFLLTGDAEEDVDPVLVARGLPPLDVLKVAHHGSATATTRELLDATRPRVAVISVGAGNTYGHPTAELLARLADVGARVYRTDRHGTIEIALRESGVAVRTSGGRSSAATLGYDRAYDRPGTPRGRPAADRPQPVGEVRQALLRRGGHRRPARRARGGERAPGRRWPDRGRGPAARRGQAVLGRGPGRAPPR